MSENIWRSTTCNRDCPDACSVQVRVDDNRIVAIRGDRDHPITQGFVCARTRRDALSPRRERLTAPLLRSGGELRPTTWQHALDHVADTFQRIRDTHGPESILFYRGGGSLGRLKVVGDLLFSAFGPVTTHRGDICSGASSFAQKADFGAVHANDVTDLDNAGHIILWGKNLHVSSPHLIPFVRRAKARGAGVTLIDPVAHQGRSLAERHIQLRPGGDFDLAMAVMAKLFASSMKPTGAAGIDDIESLRALADSRTHEEWCRRADVETSDVDYLVEAIDAQAPCTALLGWGMGRRTNGASNVRAVDALFVLAGQVGKPGAGVAFASGGKRPWKTPEGFGEPPRTVCEPTLGLDIRSAIPSIRAAYIMCANPVAMLPQSDVLVEELKRMDQVVVVDNWLSDTVRYADVVLPTTDLFEANDVIASYGHHYVGRATPVVDRPEGVKDDVEILAALAERWGLQERIHGDVDRWRSELVDESVIDPDFPDSVSVRNPNCPVIAYEGGRFSTSSKKATTIDKPTAESYGAFDDDVVDEQWPLVLMSLSTRDAQSSQWTIALDEFPAVTVHPESAPCADGERAVLRSAIGEMQVRIRIDLDQRRDVAIIAKGLPQVIGQSANRLIRARTTDAGEGAALYDERVRLDPLSEDQQGS